MQWYSPLFSTHVRPELCTADTYTPTSSIISTWAISADFSTLDGRTKILTRRSEKGRASPALTPSYREPRLDGQAMSPEYLVADYQSRYCRENSAKASGLLGQKKRFKDMHQRRPRSLSSTWLSSTFEQQQIQQPRTIAILRDVLIQVTLFVQTKLYWCEQHCFKYKQDWRG